MALPSSGSISLSQVNTELGLSSTAQISLNNSAVRTLFGKASGMIAMSDGYGKANQFAFTISSNQTNANLASLATAAGWNGSSKVVATIASGIYISSNSTGTPALTVNGSFPGGVELINNGFIVGRGGNGGNGGACPSTLNRISGTAGAAGGTALSVSSAITITNNNTVAGGGGGGGGGAWREIVRYNEYGQYIDSAGCGGGGGGGGRTGTTNSSGGSGGNGYIYTGGGSAGNPNGSTGGAGTSSAAGAGGTRGSQTAFSMFGGTGGEGGGWGSGGSTGANGGAQGSGGAGGGAASGGAAGAAVSGNSNITWVATGTRLGAIA